MGIIGAFPPSMVFQSGRPARLLLNYRASLENRARFRAAEPLSAWRRRWATPSLALLQQEWADAIGPGSNHIPVPVIALRPDTKEDAQAKLKPIAG
jgi:hypothetical protein